MAIPKGRNTKIEIALTYGTAKVVSAVTKASPGVASSVGHLLANGSCGYFGEVVGMDQLDGQAIAIANQASGTFELQKLNTLAYSTFASGNFYPVLTWGLLSKSTGYEIPNGEADDLDATTLVDTVKQSDAGLLSAQNVTISGFSDFDSSVMDVVQDAAINNALIVVRMTLSNGARRVFRGQPSLPGESMSVGALATSGFSFKTKGRVLYLPAAV